MTACTREERVSVCAGRNWRSGVVALVGVVLGGGLLLSSTDPASAGVPSDKLRARIARQPDGPYGVGVRLNLELGDAKNAYMKVKSVTGQSEPATLEQALFPKPVTVRYFKKNGTEITDQV